MKREFTNVEQNTKHKSSLELPIRQIIATLNYDEENTLNAGEKHGTGNEKATPTYWPRKTSQICIHTSHSITLPPPPSPTTKKILFFFKGSLPHNIDGNM